MPPTAGSDTEFAGSIAAFEALGPEMRGCFPRPPAQPLIARLSLALAEL